MTSAERWAAVRAVVEAALAVPSAERAAVLAERCGEDAALLAEAAVQLQACEAVGESEDFLEGSAIARAAPLLASDADSPDPATLLGEALAGRYEIEAEVARGGSAIVYRARDCRHDRQVALKVIDPALGRSLSTGRFLREIRVTAGLAHPHILPLHDSGEAAGLLYYVMPFVSGETLRERLARGPRLGVDAALRLMRDVASALDHAHRHGVVHRDIKPANILLADGHAIVADFGIARAVQRATDDGADEEEGAAAPSAPSPDTGRTLTDAGTSPGTPGYMAPEQIRAEAVDHRADLYALGVVAWEAVAGSHPFHARPPGGMLDAHLHETPRDLESVRPEVPRRLAALVTRLLSKDPSARPASAADVLGELERIGARQPGGGSRWPRIAAAAGALAMVALAVAALRDRADRPAAGDPAAVTALGAARGTADPEAYELYLQGRYLWLRRGAANVTRSIAFFKAAIAEDPAFAHAHAGLALAYFVLPIYVRDPGDSTTPLLEAAASRALALDSTLAETQLALGAALDRRLDYPGAIERYRRAAALDPSSATAHHWLGLALLNVGENEEAIALLRRAVALDPFAPLPSAALAAALLWDREFEAAVREARRTLALDSTIMFAIGTLGLAQALGGSLDEGIQTLERGRALHPDATPIAAALTFTYVAAGRREEAQRVREWLNGPGRSGTGGADAGVAELVFGNAEPLVDALASEPAQRRFMADGGILGCNPLFDPLRNDPRFQQAMRRWSVKPCLRAGPG